MDEAIGLTKSIGVGYFIEIIFYHKFERNSLQASYINGVYKVTHIIRYGGNFVQWNGTQ